MNCKRVAQSLLGMQAGSCGPSSGEPSQSGLRPGRGERSGSFQRHSYSGQPRGKVAQQQQRDRAIVAGRSQAWAASRVASSKRAMRGLKLA